MKAKISVLKKWLTGNVLKGEKGELSEKLDEYILEEGQVIKESMGYEFAIYKIYEKTVKLVSNKSIAESSERGTINLLSKQKEFIIEEHNEKDITPTLTDCSIHWIIKVEGILK